MDGVTWDGRGISALESSQTFLPLIRSLSIEANAIVLGRSFQGSAAVRALGEGDHLRLLAYAEALPLEPRARSLLRRGWKRCYLPVTRMLSLQLLRDEPAGIAEKRRRYLMTEVVRRDRDLVEHLRDLYDGECQICGWAPRRHVTELNFAKRITCVG